MKLYTNALSPFAARVRAALYFKKLHVLSTLIIDKHTGGLLPLKES